jgi:hypothetical protein
VISISQKSTILSLALWASLVSGLTMSGAIAASQDAPASASPAASTQAPEQTSPDEAARRKAWSREMSRHPLPKTGCFNAAYPKIEWIEVPCGAPSPYHNQPRRRGGNPDLVGGKLGDFSAVSSGLISSAVGSFSSVNGASSVTGVVGGISTAQLNVFMFQINTQFFSNPPACNNVAGCRGWQQFLFSQTQCAPPGPGQQSVVSGSTACVQIEYWLLGFGPTCPAAQPLPGLNWKPDGAGNCWFNGPSTYVPPQTVANLAGLTFTATATAGGQDQVVLSTTSGNISAASQDSVLFLNQFWNTAEFNVFGDCCSSATNFSDPTTLVVRTSITDGTSNAPTCGTSSFTAEQNNLTLAPIGTPLCCPYGGASPAIEFMETRDAGQRAICGPTGLEGHPDDITTISPVIFAPADIITIVNDHY